MRARFVAALRIGLVTVGCLGSSPMPGEGLLQDPGIPDGEFATYSLRTGDKVTTFTERTSVLDAGTAYLIRFASATETIETWLRTGSLMPMRIRRVTEDPEQTLETVTTVTRRAPLSTQSIPVLAFTDLRESLRGFPFGRTGVVPVGFLNGSGASSGPPFTILVKYLGTEEKTAGGRSIPSFKLELQMQASGVLRVLNGLIPKTYYWYSEAPPHYLVASEGSNGFSGSAKSYVEITDYSGWH